MSKFQSKQEQLKEQLASKNTKQTLIFPKNEDNERRVPYTFTLTPSSRKKLDKLAKENGYKSTSRFLVDLINKL